MESWFPFCIIVIFFVTSVDVTEFLPCEIIIRIGIWHTINDEAKGNYIPSFIHFPCASCSYRCAGNFSIIIMITQFTYIPTCNLALRTFTCINVFYLGVCFYFRASCQIRIVFWITCCFLICLIQYIQEYRQIFYRCWRVYRIIIFSNANFQVSIRNQTEQLICVLSNCYSVLLISCHRNTDLFAGTNQFILCQYDFGNVPCSYIFRIGGVPEIIHVFISTQTISICKIFLTVKTYLFVTVQTWQVGEVRFCAFIHIHTDRTIYGIPYIVFAIKCPSTSQGNITCNSNGFTNLIGAIVPAIKCVGSFVSCYICKWSNYSIFFTFSYCYLIRNLKTRREFTEYLISNSAFTGFRFLFECYINGVRLSNFFKGVFVRFLSYAFRNFLTIYCNGVNNISVICFNFKCLIFTIFYHYRFFGAGNSAVFPSGCFDSRVEICIDFVNDWIQQISMK